MSTPYTLSNGREINLRTPTVKDVDSIDSWLRQTYINQANETVKLLPDTVQKSFMLDVLDKAMILSTQFGDGRSMMFANVYGAARFVYSHVAEQDTMTFEEFHDILYPDGFMVETGTNALIAMLGVLYPNIPEMQVLVGVQNAHSVNTSDNPSMVHD